jgi:predicted nuclease with TOPRIM domain
MKRLKKLLDARSLKKEIARLEAALREKDELIRKLREDNSSLNERLKGLLFKYKDMDSKLSGMNYRLFSLSRDNEILKMNLAGAKAQRDGALKWIEKIKEEADGGGNK